MKQLIALVLKALISNQKYYGNSIAIGAINYGIKKGWVYRSMAGTYHLTARGQKNIKLDNKGVELGTLTKSKLSILIVKSLFPDLKGKKLSSEINKKTREKKANLILQVVRVVN